MTVAYGAFSHKLDYVIIFKEILNPEVHPNRITGSKVTAILLIGWILRITLQVIVPGASEQSHSTLRTWMRTSLPT